MEKAAKKDPQTTVYSEIQRDKNSEITDKRSGNEDPT
jgi:hypothetical protein